MDYGKQALKLHKKLAGKIQLSSKVKVSSKDTLSTIYTPGVGAVSTAIAKNKNLVRKLTGKANSVAIVSNGTAVLGLGNIGPEAALPVMEGKAVLFSEFGGVDAYPLCIQANSPEEVVQFVKAIAPTFGAVNLEDIKAPECFEIEGMLQDLEIPVFHDDQDGAAIVILAALVNAAKITGKRLRDLKVVILGAGAAGSATAWMLLSREKWMASGKVTNSFFESPADVIMVDSKGIIDERRPDLNPWKKMLAVVTNRSNKRGGLTDALRGADVFIGLSSGGKLTPPQVKLMNKNPIIFALANPVPEITPQDAKTAGAALVATGRSDFPNQINNALCFPGLFRGILDTRVIKITSSLKYRVAAAIAESVNPTKNQILPSVLNRKVHQKIAQAVQKAA